MRCLGFIDSFVSKGAEAQRRSNGRLLLTVSDDAVGAECERLEKLDAEEAVAYDCLAFIDDRVEVRDDGVGPVGRSSAVIG